MYTGTLNLFLDGLLFFCFAYLGLTSETPINSYLFGFSSGIWFSLFLYDCVRISNLNAPGPTP
jgi:hypothetical protein